jgi:hypothetical protein
MAAITNNPTFNKNTSNHSFPGFYSRALFSYAPYGDGTIVPNLLGNNNSDWVVDSTWDGIGDLLTSGANVACHGSNILPAYYWRPGKTIRITGDLSVNIPLQEGFIQNRTLNLRFGLIETNTPSSTALAIQNNDNNHELAFKVDGGPYTYVPIHFECTIICAEIDEGQDPPCTFYANGFYYYDFTNYFSSGENFNKSSVYVPVWKTGNGSTTLDQVYYTSSTKIMMNFYDSLIGNGDDGYGAIYLSKLLIEELA